ncbi:hypothetical protein ACTMU2_26985 [Cupriavidus basilensis]
MRNSQWQARYLGRFASQLTYEVQPGASDGIRFPHSGPYDDRMGYGRLPLFAQQLASAASTCPRNRRACRPK